MIYVREKQVSIIYFLDTTIILHLSMKKQIILASTSPRRKELLEKAGVEFSVVPSDYEEDMSLDMPAQELVKFLSKGKAEALRTTHPHALIIGADTLVVFEEHILGKPHTVDRAREMLHLLSGTVHSIFTGFTVIDSDTDKEFSKAIETKVWFRQLSEEDIDQYVATGEPLDRAGAYAIQGGGKIFVDHFEGDFSNAIGLPVNEVLTALREAEAL